ncbi:type II secretion system minor pseudopilin GspJ [Oceanicoccus sagamiensis]|uniref:Type II secretion system protein J n=1 Tax=Oceanicoccus sagamiensis TaxID=716816 RepID=A0A1X9NL83_9GAMM|nr:type II secretion system minor pseudopilin GspJ [Oceanicoccus sagamiensis]ARN75597.1 type II secretion system protein GspJ [Oceanicoccus sagamiensis]
MHAFTRLSLQQQGLTLLEVLIALSIFSLIGIASYQVLNTTIQSQQATEVYSRLLSQRQKALMIIDRDLQQVLVRNIRNTTSDSVSFLEVNQQNYPLEFSRGGHRNPLMLPRSSMQRIAYDIGPHPQSANRDSQHYRDGRRYLRRHIWPMLDREEDASAIVQVLLPDIATLSITVVSEQGRHRQWPLPEEEGAEDTPPEPLAIEMAVVNQAGDQFTRLYPVLR